MSLDYLTPDLVKRIEKSPNLVKLFNNPEFLDAINQLSKDPEVALAKYGKNKEFMQALKDWMLIMGDGLQNINQKNSDIAKDQKSSKISALLKSSSKSSNTQLQSQEEKFLMEKVIII